MDSGYQELGIAPCGILLTASFIRILISECVLVTMVAEIVKACQFSEIEVVVMVTSEEDSSCFTVRRTPSE
jgi:hypothetical protein